MSGRRRFTGDSLDLLLDTVCSMFGAITLIAILVALLAQTGKTDTGVRETNAEMLERKVAMAEADLEATRKLRAQMIPVENEQVVAALVEKRQLQAALESAKAARDKAGQELEAQVVGQNANVSAEAKRLAAERSALERRAVDLENTIASQVQNTARLNARTGDLSKQLGDEQRTRIVTLRFPKERAKTKESFPVICKFGKVYPIYDQAMKQNQKTIAWVSKGTSELSKPIEALGWRTDADAALIAGSLQAIRNSEYYIVYLVYPDSVSAFRTIRDKAVEAGFDVGFELIPAENTLAWGPGGSQPPPL